MDTDLMNTGLPDSDLQERKVRDRETGEAVVKAEPKERQSVEVKPMRYVLGVGIALAIVAMTATYLTI